MMDGDLGEAIGGILFFTVWVVMVSIPLLAVIFSLKWLKGRIK
jgi:hypothetical protein|tara:strand:- start:410 stop:538 length:129 start_codon:yes stop_codon:yes gene_type:complete